MGRAESAREKRVDAGGVGLEQSPRLGRQLRLGELRRRAGTRSCGETRSVGTRPSPRISDEPARPDAGARTPSARAGRARGRSRGRTSRRESTAPGSSGRRGRRSRCASGRRGRARAPCRRLRERAPDDERRAKSATARSGERPAPGERLHTEEPARAARARGRGRGRAGAARSSAPRRHRNMSHCVSQTSPCVPRNGPSRPLPSERRPPLDELVEGRDREADARHEEEEPAARTSAASSAAGSRGRRSRARSPARSGRGGRSGCARGRAGRAPRSRAAPRRTCSGRPSIRMQACSEDQAVGERRQRKAPVRRDDQDGRRHGGRDLEDPGVAVLRTDARKQNEQRRPDGEEDAGSRRRGPVPAQLSQSVTMRSDLMACHSAALTLSGTVHAKSWEPPPSMHSFESIAICVPDSSSRRV